MSQKDQSTESLVSLLQEATKQVDDLRILLDKVSLMAVGVYEAVRVGKYFLDQTGISSILPRPK